MKNSFFNTLRNIIIIFVLLGSMTAGVDYLKIKAGETPIFNIKQYNENTKIQTFRGIFYKAERKVSISENESLRDSSEIKYKILIFDINVPSQFKEIQEEYNIETKEISNCTEQSKLYFASKDIKVYTYCLEDIKIKDSSKTTELSDYLKKRPKIFDVIDSKLTYLGLVKNQEALIFKDKEHISNLGITLYRCNKNNINDIYIGPENMTYQADFCTDKDDDLKFLFEIKEEEVPAGVEPAKEIIFTDENYSYELTTPSANINIIKPAVRGKEEIKYPLKTVLDNNLLTIDELIAKGLKVNKIPKTQ